MGVGKEVPSVRPRNKEGKSSDSVVNVIASFVSDERKDAFVAEYGNKINEFPFELEGSLSYKNGWGAFVIDFMVQACKMLKSKGYTFTTSQKVSKICAISFLGLLDMYEENAEYSRNRGKFFKFKDSPNALYGYERTLAICSRYGIQLDDTDIECISMYKHIEQGDKMTLLHASPTARLIYASYQLTKLDFSI